MHFQASAKKIWFVILIEQIIIWTTFCEDSLYFILCVKLSPQSDEVYNLPLDYRPIKKQIKYLQIRQKRLLN